jgi:hypothetical protein
MVLSSSVPPLVLPVFTVHSLPIPWNPLFVELSSFLSFACLFVFLRFFLPRFFHFSLSSSSFISLLSYSLSFVHSLLSLLAFSFILPYSLSLPLDEPSRFAFSDVWLFDASLAFTNGYLLFDLFVLLFYRSLFPSFSSTFLHHLLILLAFHYGLFSHIGTFYMSNFLFNELSTIFLNFHYIFQHLQLFSFPHPIAHVNGLALVFTFFVARILWNFALLIHQIVLCWWPLRAYWMNNSQLRISDGVIIQCASLSVLSVLHIAMNGFWWMKILKSLRRKFNKQSFQANKEE